MAAQWLPFHEDATWFGHEPNGRWTRGDSRLTVDETESYSQLELEMSNCHARQQLLDIELGATRSRVEFAPGERKTVTLNCEGKAPTLRFRSETFAAAAGSGDPRLLGVLVHEVRYR